MPYDAKAAERADNLYKRIADLDKSLRVSVINPARRERFVLDDLCISIKYNDGYREQDKARITRQDFSASDADAIIAHAYKLHRTSLQAKINACGRELAQLGFTKPECCK